MTDDINATEQNPLTRQTSPESHQLSVAINYRAKESKHTKKKKKIPTLYQMPKVPNTNKTPP
jgi:hypothetical protein